ncbi:MAG: fluoride efflux transporter CrcB [Chloroflexi bacterium]|nr:fluoride efflux transporter CrcB [Chloroflexota bacterium]
MQLLAIGVGGAVGALLRYALRELLPPIADGRIPVATLAANIAGSFLLGLLGGIMLQRAAIPAELRLGVTIGLLGAFTTFSTFSGETVDLLRGDQWPFAMLNVVLSVSGALLALWAGQTLARA